MPIELHVSYKGENQVLYAEESDILRFPAGFVGFPGWRRFVLLEDPEEAPVAVLQCLDDTMVSFLVTDPWYVCPEYCPRIPQDSLSAIGLADLAEARLLCILTLKSGPLAVTANLLGPLIINRSAKIASQVVLEDSSYPAQYPVIATDTPVAGSIA